MMTNEEQQYDELYGTWDYIQCPYCGETHTMFLSVTKDGEEEWMCEDCWARWVHVTAQNDRDQE